MAAPRPGPLSDPSEEPLSLTFPLTVPVTTSHHLHLVNIPALSISQLI